MGRPGRLLSIVAAALALVLLGCGDDDAGQLDGAQPVPDADEFADTLFDELPRYPRSEEVAPASVQADVVNQSFLARDTTASDVVDFYVDQLQEWDLVQGPQASATVAWADWVRSAEGGDRRLRVTATSMAPTVGEPGDVQYDVVLYPDAAERPTPTEEGG